MQPRDIQSLRRAIKARHGCESLHTDSVAVYEVFEDKTAWHGTVEVFNLLGHTEAKRCYAWQHRRGDETKTVTVLETPPVDSPQTAVKVAISVKARDK